MYKHMSIPRGLTPAEERRLYREAQAVRERLSQYGPILSRLMVTKVFGSPIVGDPEVDSMRQRLTTRYTPDERRLIRERLNGHLLADAVLGLN